jgi:hypothetical protein
MSASDAMRPFLLAAALVGATGPGLADVDQPSLTAEEFETHVTGKTVTYSQFGSLFGIEEYLPDRQVRWSVAENTCQYGSWYPQGRDICFVYEDDPTPHCWTFWRDKDRLVALSVGAGPGEELHEVERSDQPLSCPGPDVGV